MAFTIAMVGASGLSLAKLEAGFRVAREVNLGTKIVSTSSLTPLFRASGLQRAIFSSPRFNNRGAVGPGSTESKVRFAEIDYDDVEVQ